MKNEDIKEGLILRNSWNEFCDSLKEAATIIKSEELNDPFSAKSNSDFSKFSIIF